MTPSIYYQLKICKYDLPLIKLSNVPLWHCAFILLICKTTSNMLAIQHLHLLKIKNVPCIDKIEHATATTKFPISLYVLIKKLHGMFALFFIALF